MPYLKCFVTQNQPNIMKKPIFTLLLALCISALFGQSNHLHVIVMMAERYDDSQLSQKTALMTKEQRRDFVIAERKAFCQSSQAQVLDFLEGYKSNNLVSDLKTFWSFNGFSCSASDEVIAQLAQRKDVAMIIPDEMRQMIPSNEMARRHHRPHRHGRQLQPYRHHQQHVGRRQRVSAPRL